MLIALSVLKSKFDVNPTSILHVGAHKAEELNDYEKEWPNLEQPIYWIEGQQDLAENLVHRLNPERNVVIQAYVWHEDGVELNFNVASNSQSSSLLEFGTHVEKLPEVQYTSKVAVNTQRLDSILPPERHFDFINLDLQGVELQALKGLGKRLYESTWIYTEVNKEQVYIGCADVKELDIYLKTFGFCRLATRWVPGLGWGDALYGKNPKFYNRYISKSIFRFRESLRTIYILLRDSIRKIGLQR